jgi:dATP pyrophosphohydrolase
MTFGRDIPTRCRAVACIALRRMEGGAEVLLLKRADGPMTGVWTQVTGGIEPDETAAQAAARELAEETGLAPTAFYSAGWVDHFYNPAADCIEVVPLFLAEIAPDAAVVLDHEHSEWEWVSLDAAAARVPHHGHRVALDAVRHTFVDRVPPEWLRLD